MSRGIIRQYNIYDVVYRGVAHAILGHFKKRISKLNVIVRLLTKPRGVVLMFNPDWRVHY